MPRKVRKAYADVHDAERCLDMEHPLFELEGLYVTHIVVTALSSPFVPLQDTLYIHMNGDATVPVLTGQRRAGWA